MYKFRITIDVVEDKNGIHQENNISPTDGGNYNGMVVLGALEQAKIKLYDDIMNENKKE